MSDTWRRLAVYLLIFGIAGTATELVLLEHYEDPWQWTPLALLALGGALGVALAARPSRATLRALKPLMALYVLAGALGVFLHLRSNVEFERELRPTIAGRDLMMETLKGAIPAFAPGAMVQLGLLGLLICYRNPLLHTKGDEHA
jgi:hypothetical protein